MKESHYIIRQALSDKIEAILQSHKNNDNLKKKRKKKSFAVQLKWKPWLQFEGGHKTGEPFKNTMEQSVTFTISFQQNNAQTHRASATTPQQCVKTVGSALALQCCRIGLHENPWFYTTTQLVSLRLALQ